MDSNAISTILADANFVIDRAKHVQIERDKINEFATKQTEESMRVPDWEERYHFRGDDEKTVAYLLVLSAMNFASCKLDAWKYELEGEILDGYFAVSSALKIAFENGMPLDDASFLKGLSESDFNKIFDGTGELTFAARRIEMLREVGRVLDSKFDGKAISLVRSANQSALRLVSQLVENFDSFVDTARYDQKTVAFHKRAQIFCGDLYGAFQGHGVGEFHDIDRITAFPDDSLPYAFRNLGWLQYSESLSTKVDSGVAIESGAAEEVEIRASTIVAMEMFRDALAEKGIVRNSVQLDWIFWNLANEEHSGRRHFTFSTAY